MARSSLRVGVRLASISFAGALLMMSAGSCLVTTSPEFRDPIQTAPMFIADLTSPDPHYFITLPDPPGSKDFVAYIQSEDLGEAVESYFYSDYGTPNVNGDPFWNALQGGEVAVAATWADGPRKISLHVNNLGQLFTDGKAGCHRLTWVVAHKFQGEAGHSCPAPPLPNAGRDGQTDYDEITWTVFTCDSTGCPSIDVTNIETECPPPVTKGCQAFSTASSQTSGGGS